MDGWYLGGLRYRVVMCIEHLPVCTFSRRLRSTCTTPSSPSLLSWLEANQQAVREISSSGNDVKLVTAKATITLGINSWVTALPLPVGKRGWRRLVARRGLAHTWCWGIQRWNTYPGNTNTQMQIHKYQYTNTNTLMQRRLVGWSLGTWEIDIRVAEYGSNF